jgi:hypothetical protein
MSSALRVLHLFYQRYSGTVGEAVASHPMEGSPRLISSSGASWERFIEWEVALLAESDFLQMNVSSEAAGFRG